MADTHRDDVARLDLQTVVGSRLREQRIDRGASLRDTATGAGISPGHLSDIENGNSHASLPVLLRLCRALHLPVADLLPRLGGRRIRETSVKTDGVGSERLSHPELELRIDRIALAAGNERHVVIDAGDDVLLFVVSGACRVDIAGNMYDLGQRDAIDVERTTHLDIRSTEAVTILLIRASRH
jgi:transcriptional regulator with XRE-family HTH domain